MNHMALTGDNTSSPMMSGTSAEACVDRFDSPEAAAKYARSLVGSRTHQREVRCIRRGLADVPRGSTVLDLPCGAGRLLPTLVDLGFRVTEADSSPHMLERARDHAVVHGVDCADVAFAVANALSTGFDDGAFDAVVCNRLFHHFIEPETRRAALRELQRISAGPMVVSFFCSWGWDGFYFHLRNALRRRKADDRIPIGYRTFAGEVESVGLRVRRVLPTRPGVSKQWYLVLERA